MNITPPDGFEADLEVFKLHKALLENHKEELSRCTWWQAFKLRCKLMREVRRTIRHRLYGSVH